MYLCWTLLESAHSYRPLPSPDLSMLSSRCKWSVGLGTNEREFWSKMASSKRSLYNPAPSQTPPPQIRYSMPLCKFLLCPLFQLFDLTRWHALCPQEIACSGSSCCGAQHWVCKYKPHYDVSSRVFIAQFSLSCCFCYDCLFVSSVNWRLARDF